MQIPGLQPKLLHHCLGTGSWECAFKLDLQEVPKCHNTSAFLVEEETPTLHCRCQAVGPPCTDTGGGMCRGLGPNPCRREQDPFPRPLLTGAPTCPGGPGSPGGPWNPCGTVFTREVWAGEGEAGAEAIPRDPCFCLPHAVPPPLRGHATPCLRE